MTARRGTRLAALAAMIGMTVAATPASAQAPIVLEVGGGGATGHFGQTHARASFSPLPSWRVAGGYAPLPRFHVLASYGESEFRCDRGLCAEAEPSFRSAGPGLAVRFSPRDGPGGPWIQAEALRQTLRTDGPDGELAAGPALAWGLAAGAALPLGRHASLSPVFRVVGYRTPLGDEDPTAYAVLVAAFEVALRVTPMLPFLPQRSDR